MHRTEPIHQRSDSAPAAPWVNWSGSQHCRPRSWARPVNEGELADVVARAGPALRVTGAGHSFSAVVPTDETLISLERLAGIVATDSRTQRATCWAGSTLHDIGEPLAQQDLALRNQGDVDAQTLAGACATGTHGTGLEFGCLAADVVSFHLITAAGEILECSPERHPEVYQAGRVSLGTLGVLSQLTVQCTAAFALHEKVQVMDLDDCLQATQQLARGNRHFEFFHFPFADRVLVKTMNVTEKAGGLKHGDRHEDTLFRWACHLINVVPRLNPLIQRTAMRWYPGRERSDASYRVFPSARTVRFNEMEYEVPWEAGVDCYQELLGKMRSLRLPVWFPLEFRRVRGDDLWLSPFYGRDSVSISVHQHHKLPYRDLFAALEPVFWKYDGRPHWGKLHALSAEQLKPLYPRWNEFMELRQQLDPEGKFLTSHLRRLLLQGARSEAKPAW